MDAQLRPYVLGEEDPGVDTGCCDRDEVRNLLARAIDAIEEHATLLAEVDRDRDRWGVDGQEVQL